MVAPSVVRVFTALSADEHVWMVGLNLLVLGLGGCSLGSEPRPFLLGGRLASVLFQLACQLLLYLTAFVPVGLRGLVPSPPCAIGLTPSPQVPWVSWASSM